MTNTRRSDFDVTNSVQVSSPQAVLAAVEALYRPTWPGMSLEPLRRVAGAAPRDWPVTCQVRRRVAMTTQAEVVKASFGANANVGAAAAMTTYARVVPALICEVVMT